MQSAGGDDGLGAVGAGPGHGDGGVAAGAPDAGLRQRHVLGGAEAAGGARAGGAGGGGGARGRLARGLRHLDMYPKVSEEFRVRTRQGAAISVVGWVLMALLALAEVGSYLGSSVRTREHMVVDTSLGDKLQVNLNVTFHGLTCLEVDLDAMDVAGDNQLHLEHDMVKQRIGKDGELLGEPVVEKVSEMEKMEKLPADYCGSCYGAETAERSCCNTCGELLLAYNDKGWNTKTISKESEQCVRDHDNPLSQTVKGEGCRLAGSMMVNKVAGNIHIAYGDSIVRDGRHIHTFDPADAPTYNISHTVHSLSFGTPFQGMKANPLDGVGEPATEATGLVQYFIKIVPTKVTTGAGDGGMLAADHLTNQYTYTKRFRPLHVTETEATDPTGNKHKNTAINVLPGIFFVYDLSPFMIVVEDGTTPLTHLLARLCAIVGGVYALMGIIDSLIHNVSRKND